MRERPHWQKPSYFVYLAATSDRSVWKIGKSFRPELRASYVHLGTPFPRFSLIHKQRAGRLRKSLFVEGYIKWLFKHQLVHGHEYFHGSFKDVRAALRAALAWCKRNPECQEIWPSREQFYKRIRYSGRYELRPDIYGAAP
jgi:hypothetical protein